MDTSVPNDDDDDHHDHDHNHDEEKSSASENFTKKSKTNHPEIQIIHPNP